MSSDEYRDSVYYAAARDITVPEIVARDADAAWVWRTIPVSQPKPRRRRRKAVESEAM